jgi:uncharacterized protein (TIGR02117 family)
MVRVMRRLGVAVLLLLFVPPLLYVGAAFGFAIATPRAALPVDGIAIFACDNGVHTDLVLPVSAGGVDWRTVFPQQHFAAPIEELDHINLGWGSRDFYLNTPTWADVEIGRALKALMWDETVLRVDYRWRPQPGEACAEWRVSVAEYGRIAAFVGESLRGSQGQAVRVATGYGAQDAFFAAAGQYTPIDTCNQWTGQALRMGGAPVAVWTPFSFLVLWNLPMISM